MRTVTFYDTATGEITGTVTYTGGEKPIVAPDGEAFLLGEFSEQEFYVENGVAVAFPARPKPTDSFDFATKQWLDGRDLTATKTLAKAEVIRLLSARLARATAYYTPEEVSAWGDKFAAAKRMAAGGPAEAIITDEATELGVTNAFLVNRIIANGTKFHAAVSKASGMRGKAFNAIDNAQTLTAVDAILVLVQSRLEEIVV